MPTDIANQLYNRFYGKDRIAADKGQVSAHWKNFSAKFNVKRDAGGKITAIKGYGFGGSDDDRFLAKIRTAVGNALQLSQLRYPGLEETVSEAKKTVRLMGLTFSQDALRQAYTCYFLKKHISENSINIKKILLIGDGHGILAALMSQQFPDAKIFLMDLGVTLFFQAYYLSKIFPQKQHTLLGEADGLKIGNGFFYCPAEEQDHFPPEEIDLAINVASMQEMTMDVVAKYFQLLRERKTKLFYCCNRLEKTLPDGTITRFMDYPWLKEDKHLVNEECPWHRFFFGRSAAENIKLLGLFPIPLLHRYDGVHWHRLTLLSH